MLQTSARGVPARNDEFFNTVESKLVRASTLILAFCAMIDHFVKCAANYFVGGGEKSLGTTRRPY